MGLVLQNENIVGGIDANVVGTFSYNSLTTTDKTLPGAINELNNKASTTVSLTQQEYDALPSTKLSDDIAYYITDGTPDVDNSLWTKVGTTTLNTTAKDCSGAINEHESDISTLNSNLTNIKSSSRLLITSGALTNTATSYNLSENFNNFLFISIEILQYNNVFEQVLVTSEYFNASNEGRRPVLYRENVGQIEVYKNTNTSVYIKATPALATPYKIGILGSGRIANF